MPTTSQISLDVQLTVADVARFQYYHSFRRMWPFALFVAVIFPLGLAGAVYLLFSAESVQSAEVLNSLPFIMLLGVWAFLMWGTPYVAARRQVATDRSLTQPVRYVFTEDGMQAYAPDFNYSLSWALVREIRETRRAFLIYNSPRLARIVPKRSVADAGGVDVFRRFLIERTGASKLRRAGMLGRWL